MSSQDLDECPVDEYIDYSIDYVCVINDFVYHRIQVRYWCLSHFIVFLDCNNIIFNEVHYINCLQRIFK